MALPIPLPLPTPPLPWPMPLLPFPIAPLPLPLPKPLPLFPGAALEAAMTAAEAGEAEPGAAVLPGDDGLPLLLPLVLPATLALVELLSFQIVFLAASRDGFPVVPGTTPA